VKTLLLDIGGIFFYPAWRLQGIPEISKRLHIKTSDFKKALDKYKKPFYTGKMSETEYWESVLEKVDLQTIDSLELKKLYRSYILPIPKTLDLLSILSTKFTLVSCNNSPKEWMDYRIKMYSLDKYFTKFFTSGYMGYMKPENKMYLTILESYKNEDLLYIDDNKDYISIAQEKYKIHGKTYHSYKDLLQLVR